MLLEDYQNLGQLADRVVSIERDSKRLKIFQERQQKLATLVDELRSTVVALSAFRQRKLITVDLHQKVDQLLAEVATVISEFQQDRGWMVETFKFNSLQTKVSSLKTDLELQLRQSWTVYKSQKIPMTNSDLLSLLGKIEIFKPTVQVIQRRIAEIKTVDYPKSVSHFQQIDRAIQDLSTAWGNLDEVPVAVQEFLQAATTHGASIDLLTPEVRNWLTAEGITRFFYIRLSS